MEDLENATEDLVGGMEDLEGGTEHYEGGSENLEGGTKYVAIDECTRTITKIWVVSGWTWMD